MTTSLLTVMAAGLLAGCGGGNTNNGTGGNTATGSTAAAPTQTLNMATSADYKPYEYHDTSGGGDKIVGFDIDIANAIAKQLHFKMNVTDMDFNGLLAALQSKRADFVIAGMTPTAERKKNVDFSDVYYAAHNAIVVEKSSNITTMGQLNGKKIGVQLGSIQEDVAKTIKGAQIVELNQIPQIIEELKTHRVDSAVIENTVLKGYLTTNPDLSSFLVPNQGDNGSAIAFPKGSPWVNKFNTVIADMKKDGRMDALVKKWFG